MWFYWHAVDTEDTPSNRERAPVANASTDTRVGFRSATTCGNDNFHCTCTSMGNNFEPCSCKHKKPQCLWGGNEFICIYDGLKCSDPVACPETVESYEGYACFIDDDDDSTVKLEVVKTDGFKCGIITCFNDTTPVPPPQTTEKTKDNRPGPEQSKEPEEGVFSLLHYAPAGLSQYSLVHLAVWLSGNALALINVVALRRARLVLGWVTVRGYTILVFKLTKPPSRSTQPGHPSRRNEYWRWSRQR